MRYQKLLEEGQNGADKFKNLAIFLWVLGGIFILFLFCLCGQIGLAISLIKGSSHFVSSTLTTLVVPILHTVFIAVIFIIWLTGFLYVFSIGYVRHDPDWLFGDIVWEDMTKTYIWFLIFTICWWISFQLASNIFVLSSMSASWYFSDDNDGVTFLTGFCWAYTYHIGSLAFGSLIIAILWFIQIILGYIYQKVKNMNSNVAWVIKCVQCFVACFERLVKFVNRHAFIEIVIRKTNFCSAVCKAVGLLTSNFFRVGVLMGLVGLILILGTIFITFVVCLICFFTIDSIGKS